MTTTTKLAAMFMLIAVAPMSAMADAGFFSTQVTKFGDFLSSWGRSSNVTAPVGVIAPPAMTAKGAAGNDCNKLHQQLADQNIKNQNAMIDSSIQPSKKSIADMPCFDKYKNFSLSSMFGFPSLSSLLDQLKGQACAYADQQVATATQPINQSVWLPGGAGRVNTGVVFGQPNAPVINPSVGSTGDFQLPQIFK